MMNNFSKEKISCRGGLREYPIIMTDAEQELLIKHQKKSKNYLEFGSGGSTFLALMNSKAMIISIESDKKWIEHLKEYDMISENEGRLKLIHANIGPVKELGIPTGWDYKSLFPVYSHDCFFIYDKILEFDTVFIDGRFRVACALQAIKNCSKTTAILMHDYTNRPQYHCIEKFLDVIETADTMVAFKIKENIDYALLEKMYEQYKYIWE